MNVFSGYKYLCYFNPDILNDMLIRDIIDRMMSETVSEVICKLKSFDKEVFMVVLGDGHEEFRKLIDKTLSDFPNRYSTPFMFNKIRRYLMSIVLAGARYDLDLEHDTETLKLSNTIAIYLGYVSSIELYKALETEFSSEK